MIGKDRRVLTEARAREIAERHAGADRLAASAIETERGWFFALEWDGELRLGGSEGLVVNKGTGRVMELGGSHLPLDRDLAMYDQGMDAEKHDLVVLEISDHDATVAFLMQLCPMVIDLSYESGAVWRIPRPMTEDEVRAHLTNLPAIFPEMELYSRFEAVVEARAHDYCVMDLPPRTN